MTAQPPPARRFRPWDPRLAVGRLVLAALTGLFAALVRPWHDQWYVRAVVGWDVGALTLIILAWVLIARASPGETRRRAGTYDPGRTTVWIIATVSSLFSLFSGAFVLHEVRGARLWSTLTLLAVFLSWVLTHTAYTLRYAHLYYRAGASGGLDFPGEAPPSDMDFAYFAFTIGMCFQVSDVAVSASEIRRAVLGHSVLSFIYNTAILALALNLAAGMLSAG